MLHVADAARDGHQRIIIRTSDSDVVVLAVWLYAQYATAHSTIEKLWVALSAGRSFR